MESKNIWLEKGVSIVTVGWNNPQRRPLINFMVVFENGHVFVKYVNYSGEMKYNQFIANLMKNVIDEVEHQKFLQIIIYNVANCKGVGEIIEGVFLHIY